MSPARFGMTDNALNCRKLTAQPALKRIHHVMHHADRERGIDVTMKIDDFTGGGFSHAHVMNLAEGWELRRKRRKQFTNFRDARRLGIAACQQIGGQRLDMSFDLDVGPKFTPDCIFEAACNLMRGRERLRTVDFEVNRHR
jgi:hypothetical protein